MSEKSSDALGWDPVWEQVFQREEWGKYPSEHVIRFVARHYYSAADRRLIRLLDLGCGPGACTWYMAREGFSVAAIDGSPTAVSRASERLRSEGLSADFHVGDFGKLPWGDNEFDGVVDNVTLSCNRFDHCRRTVAEVHRVLKPGGLFLSCNFTDRSWGYGCGREVEGGAFTEITEGGLAGRGLVLFMGRAQIDLLYRDFADRTVERVSWTADQMRQQMELWVVTCRK